MTHRFLGTRVRRAKWAALSAVAGLVLMAVGTPAFALEKVNVVVNAGTLGSNGPHFIAKDKGYFADEGLDVQFTQLGGGPTPMVAAVVSGDADIAPAGLVAGFYNSAGNGDIVTLASGTQEKPTYKSQVFVTSNAQWDKGLKSMADLAGHKVGVSAPGSGFQLALMIAAQKYHFALPKENIVPLDSTTAISAALKGGGIDAAVLTGLTGSALANAGEGHILGWVGDEAPYLVGVVFTNRKDIKTRRDMLVRYMRAYLRGAADYDTAFQQNRDAQGNFKDTPLSNELLTILATETKTPIATIRTNIAYVPADGAFDPNDVETQIKFWQQQKLVDPGITADSMIDLSILHDAQAKH